MTTQGCPVLPHCLVLLAIVVALIRWVGWLSKLSAVTEVIDLAEKAAQSTLDNALRNSLLGGVGLTEMPKDGLPSKPEFFGCVQTVDAAGPEELAQGLGTDPDPLARPGSYVDAARSMRISSRPMGHMGCARWRKVFGLGQRRTFERTRDCQAC